MKPQIKYIDGETVFFYEEVTSTMDIGRELAKDGKTGIVVAKKQTAGRGTNAKQSDWISNPGGLYLTWVFKYKPEDEETLYMVRAFVLTVTETLRLFGLKNCGIKEPNDIFVDGKKISGVLVDVLPFGVLAGVGVNLNNDLGPMSGIAISFQEIKGKPADIDKFLAEMIKKFKSIQSEFPRNLRFLIRRWRKLVIKTTAVTR
jgi:BirA family biotin operon repressor/biotin-[acetyl-CoA-carboxylase] ligase